MSVSTGTKTEVDTAIQAVELARRAGAGDADAWLTSGRRFSVTVREGEIEKLQEADSRTLVLRVFLDGGRAATVYSSDLDRDALARLAGEAVALATLMDPDPHAGLPDGPLAAGAAGDGANALALFDAGAFEQDPQALVALARRAEAAARSHDPRITNSDGATFARWQGRVALANSRGFTGGYPASSCSLGVSAIADDAEGKKRADSWHTTDRRFADLEDAEEVGRTAARRALRQLGARKAPTQEAPVVWPPEMARQFLDILARAVSGDAFYRGASFLIGHEGEPAASPLVTIADDATAPGRLGSRPFDGEGLASRRTPLFAAGRFGGFLFDSYSARKAGREATASAGRTVDARLGARVGPAPSNLVMAAGETAPEDIIAGVERGLYLTALLGFGENLTTGDFSRGANGVWIEGGQMAYPVAEVNIAGRLQDMLAAIDAVGDDATTLGTATAPTFRVARMVIGGS
ncbi:MAG: TldD/PmbA family protein [Chloroflexota bacterium]|nr:TldD/PmbA family protein [Chloroflexota bacterium]